MSIVMVLDMHEQAVGVLLLLLFFPSVIIGYQLQFVVIRHTTREVY